MWSRKPCVLLEPDSNKILCNHTNKRRNAFWQGRAPRGAVIWITWLAAPSDSSIFLDYLSILPSIRGWIELIDLLHVHPTTFEQTTIARTISDPARSVMLRRPDRGTAHASARGGNWSRRIDFFAQHFGWASETGRSRFETAWEYYLCRKEGRSHD